MKKFVLFSAVFTFVVALFFVACKKDDVTQSSTSNGYGYANPNNPYDFAGQKHNDGLDILAQYSPEKNMDMEEKFQILAAHGFEKIDYKPYAHDFALMLSSIEPIKTIADKLNGEHKISAQLHTSLIALNEIVINNGLTPELPKQVMDFEQSIVTLGLDEKETKALFMATSIARYSNEYWMKKYGQRFPNETADRRRDPRAAYVLACDIIAGVVFVAETAGVGVLAVALVAATASELAGNWWDVWHRGTGGNNIGWAWGGGIEGPCKAGYSNPCVIELNPGNSDPFYMLGAGFALSPKTLVLSMDGADLDAGFKDIFKSGEIKQEVDYTLTDDIAKEVYASGGFQTPAEATVFTKGLKKVIPVEGGYCVLYPVVFKDGSTATWYVVINLESE